MPKILIIAALLSAVLVKAETAAGDNYVNLGDDWKTGACATGKRQSPIDI
jgi:carbonic anhydrase